MKRKSMSIKFLIISYSLLNAFYWAAFVCVAYINNTLMAAGYSSVAVGSATAIGGIVGAACLPLFGYIGDKMGTSKWVFAFNLIICGIMFMFFPRFVYRIFPLVAPMCLYVGIASLMRMPTANLMDAWAVATLAPYEVNYGKVRMWGSLASAVVGIPLGMVVGKAVGQNFPFYFAQVFVVLAVIICLLLPSGDAKQSRPKEKMDFKAIFANRPFMIYLTYTLALNIYGGITGSYFAYILEGAGCPPSQIGILIGARAVVELLTMLAVSRIGKRIPLRNMLLFAGVACTVENLLYCTANGLPSLIFILVISGISGGTYFSVGPQYVYELAPKKVQYTAQSLIGVSVQIMVIAGSFIGGVIINRYGIFTLTTACGVFALILTAFFGVSFLATGRAKGRNTYV